MATASAWTSHHEVDGESSSPSSSAWPPIESSSASSNSPQLNSLSYTDALLATQKSRLELILDETSKLNEYLSTLKSQVNQLEQQTALSSNSGDGIDWNARVAKLREENRTLRIECHCLSMEVDLYASGQAPLGMTDEGFYKNIRGGPNGPLIRPTRPVPRAGPFLPPSHFPPFLPPRNAAQPHHPLPVLPPPYDEAIKTPSLPIRGNNSPDILRQVPPAPRPLWVLPAHQTLHPHQGHGPGVSPPVPPRPNNIPPRTPPTPRSNSPHVTSTIPRSNNCLENRQHAPEAAATESEGQTWNCSKCTVENHPALQYCEVCELPRNGYLGSGDNAEIILMPDITTHVCTQNNCYCHHHYL